MVRLDVLSVGRALDWIDGGGKRQSPNSELRPTDLTVT